MTDRIGDFLVRIEAIQPYQVDDVVRAQQGGEDRLCGEIAIEFGYINNDAVEKYVEAKAVWEKEA